MIENQAAYLKGWLGCLKHDSKLLVSAAAAAQKAADWVVRAQPEGEPLFPGDLG